MWEGLKEYAITGHNTGPVPVRVRRGPHAPPEPDEGQHGATRARLVIDPERGPWVTKMFEWRTDEKLSFLSIAHGSATGRAAPCPAPRGHRHRQHHPRQPQVHRADRHGGTRNTGRQTPASAKSKHPARALDLGRRRQRAPRTRRHGASGKPPRPSAASAPSPRPPPPATRGPTTRYAPGSAAPSASAACPSSPPAPATEDLRLLRLPPQPRRPPPPAKQPRPRPRRRHETTTSTPPSTRIITTLLYPPTCADMLRRSSCPRPGLTTTTSATTARAQELQRQINQNETAQARAHHPAGTDSASDATPSPPTPMRQRITDQFTVPLRAKPSLPPRPNSTRSRGSRAPAEDDPSLLDELPYARLPASVDAPEHIKAKIYAAFDIQVLYRAPIKNRPPSGQPSPSDHPRHHHPP